MTDMPQKNVLVVGAGPSGLAFAIESARNGINTRIIEKRALRKNISKATGLASGALEWLKDFKVTSTILNSATPMRKFIFYDNEKIVAEVPVPEINVTPPAYLYPQIKIEQLLENELSKYGVNVEYSVMLEKIEQNTDGITVELDNNGKREIQTYDWVIGADGAHSLTRELAGFNFIGKDYPEDWSVSEVITDKWDKNIQAKLYLNSDGTGLFMSSPEQDIVQGIFNSPGAAEKLKDKLPGCKLNYERNFHVSLRRVKTPRKKRVWLIGDAAHVQSPVGGQGLNLALWDGVTLAQALKNGNFDIEKILSRRAKIVLTFTDFDYRMLSSKSKLLRTSRNIYWQTASKYPFIAKWFFHLISGKW